MTETMTYPLRLPRSIKKAVEQQSREDGTSINQFVATAVAEKLSAFTNGRVLRWSQRARRFQSFRQTGPQSKRAPQRSRSRDT
jgi:hypothetical protein